MKDCVFERRPYARRMKHTPSITPLVVLIAGLPLSAQPCTPEWDTAAGNPGIAGGYAAPIRGWNDGAGERLYVGGSFTSVPGGGAYLSKWDPATGTWAALGSGISGGFTNAFMTCLTPFTPNAGGERLVAGGFFDTAGGVSGTASLAMWTGTTWESMGTGWTGTTRQSVWSSAVWNGRLYIGGGIVNTPALIAGQPWAGSASWDGTTWTPLASSIAGFSPFITALRVFNDGSGEALYAAGRFSSINGVTGTAQIARWNGTVWSSVGGGLTATSVTQGLEGMTVFNDGTGDALYVAGTAVFGTGLSTCNVAKWNGTAWTAVGAPFATGKATSIAVFDDGTGPALYVGCTATPSLNYIARFQGGSWQILGGGVTGGAIPPSNFPSVFGLGVFQNKLYLGGNFVQVNNLAANGVAAWTSCPPSCYANCDASSIAPVLTANDFTCFLNRYIDGESYANCDGSSVAPVLTANDFACFLNAYVAGCT
jgi:trimeric autotransporter adhesin